MLIVTKIWDPEDDITFIFNALRYTCSEDSRYFYIYGGAPRDLIRGKPFRDIDIYIKDTKNICNFINFLKRANRLRKEVETRSGNYSQYSSISLEIQTTNNTVCLLDITSDRGEAVAQTTCDFTCNNLMITREGNITTRLPPPNNITLGTLSWTFQCIRDAVDNKLCWMIPDYVVKKYGPKEYNCFCDKMKERLQKMYNKGFISPPLSMGIFECRELKIYQPVVGSSCAICKEDYLEKPDKLALTLKCSHNFHVDCIDTWATSGRYHTTCPICREVIELVFS